MNRDPKRHGRQGGPRRLDDKHPERRNRRRVFDAELVVPPLHEDAEVAHAAGEAPGRGEKPVAVRLVPPARPGSGDQEGSQQVVVEGGGGIVQPGAPTADRLDEGSADPEDPGEPAVEAHAPFYRRGMLPGGSGDGDALRCLPDRRLVEQLVPQEGCRQHLARLDPADRRLGGDAQPLDASRGLPQGDRAAEAMDCRWRSRPRGF